MNTIAHNLIETDPGVVLSNTGRMGCGGGRSGRGIRGGRVALFIPTPNNRCLVVL